MVKNHLKRLNAPRTWQIKRKNITFISKPAPGPHKKGFYLPLNVVIRDLLKLAKSNREVRFILTNEVLIDGIKRTDIRFPVGMMDIIEFKELKKHYRVVLNKKGKLDVKEVKKEDSGRKLCKVSGKSIVKGKIQIHLHDGKNIIIDKKEGYKVGDSVVISVPKSEIEAHLKLENGSCACLVGGKHIGGIGKIVDIMGPKLKFESFSGEVFETLKEYAFVVGKDKPVIVIQ